MQDIQKTVAALIDAAAARKLAEFELETGELKLRLKFQPGPPAPAAPAAAVTPVPAATQPAAPQPAVPDAPAGRSVAAPLVGIFYAAPAPDEPPFIEVGQSVKKGDTLFVIEAMKTMNEIPAPCDGKISHILAQSGDLVEYGQVVVLMEEDV